jgi:hypothetical protein
MLYFIEVYQVDQLVRQIESWAFTLDSEHPADDKVCPKKGPKELQVFHFIIEYSRGYKKCAITIKFCGTLYDKKLILKLIFSLY